MRKARRRLEYFQSDHIKQEMRSFTTIGSLPALSLPTIMEESELHWPHPKSPSGAIQQAFAAVSTNRHPRRNTPKAVPTPKTSSEVHPDWRLPSGRKFADLFGGEKNRHIREGFPNIPHHNPLKSKKAAKPCLTWFVEGHCHRQEGCYLSHLPVSEIPADSFSAITEKLKAVYSS